MSSGMNSTAHTTVQVTAPPRRPPKPTGPCAMVIFGAGGDLTKRLLVPALYNLANTGLLGFTTPGRIAVPGSSTVTNTAWRPPADKAGYGYPGG